MTTAATVRLIVCEPTRRWAPLVRRFDDGMNVDETRSLSLLSNMLEAQPTSFVAIAPAPADLPEAAAELARIVRNYPLAAFATLLDLYDTEADLAFREAGAQLVITSLLELPAVIRMARRHAELAPSARLSFREAVAARMPWA